MQIRWFIQRDMEFVLNIEQASFSSDWAEDDFLHALRQRNCIGMVAELGDEVVGFMLYGLFKDRLDLLNFAVHPQCRRQGVGTQMMTKLISKLSSHRRTRIRVHVSEANLPMQLFLRSLGFRAVSVERSYYPDEQDAYRMVYRLPSEALSEI